jgi:hypothetical protein
VRNRVGVTVRKDALEKKEEGAAPVSSAPPARKGPPSKFGS